MAMQVEQYSHFIFCESALAIQLLLARLIKQTCVFGAYSVVLIDAAKCDGSKMLGFVLIGLAVFDLYAQFLTLLHYNILLSI